MDRTIHLRMYGSIEHGPDMDLPWDLYQSLALSRLRDVSLSSTPSRFAAHGMAASRFEHSVGVGYLARKLCDWRSGLKPYRDLLVSAALCHDIGSPPFSHIAELFLWDMTGRTHEEQTQRLLGPGSELGEILTSYNVEPSEVVDIVNGRHETLSPLIAGTIDLDNVDNSIHLLVSLGYHDAMPYHPLRLLKAFRFRQGQVSLDTEYLSEILGWAEARRTLYGVLNDEPHLSSSSMLYRALEFAYSKGKLDESFFDLGESDALHDLRYRCGQESGILVDRALRWKQYPRIYEKVNPKPDPRLLGLYDDWRARKDFADAIASELDIDPVDLSIYVGQDKGEKSISVPFSGDRAQQVAAFFDNRPGQQRIAVFAEKHYRRLRDSKRLSVVVERVIDQLPEPAKDNKPHVFF